MRVRFPVDPGEIILRFREGFQGPRREGGEANGFVGLGEEFEAGFCGCIGCIEILGGQEVANGFDGVVDVVGFVDQFPAVCSGAVGAEASGLFAFETGEAFGGPAVDNIAIEAAVVA